MLYVTRGCQMTTSCVNFHCLYLCVFILHCMARSLRLVFLNDANLTVIFPECCSVLLRLFTLVSQERILKTTGKIFSRMWGSIIFQLTTLQSHISIVNSQFILLNTRVFQVKSSYCHNKSSFPLDKIVPTVGLNVGKIITQGVKITLWDMGGQDALRYVTLITPDL